ncbi:hypothetical protein GCWU000282_03243 [Catonella morbi ATCC 51271]|uniref:Uncharacterized protein n=1 Tax=Catonella morbi ATCC 51271 TaxID=592026 RepID=V2Y0U8_9FIRM|nr:hypothetical protein GCWU000282_03243 [Catonella morbi ATCC 51271]
MIIIRKLCCLRENNKINIKTFTPQTTDKKPVKPALTHKLRDLNLWRE